MEDFDFGFTAIDEDELTVVEDAKKIVNESEAITQSAQERLKQLHEAILPLLNNLRKDPEKQYIVWPNRVAKIDAFEAKIAAIVNGEHK